MHYMTVYPSPIGLLTLQCDGSGNLTGLWIEGQKYHGGAGALPKDKELPIFTAAKKWLDRYFAGEKPDLKELPLAPAGSSFRRDVWRILCGIPYGKVITYGDIAKRIAAQRGLDRMSGQAVGGAVGHNPISIIIPCHRVVGGGGSLTGYSAGLKIKMRLLESEGVDISQFYAPKTGTAL